jgi:hypothetical protein
LIDIYDLACFGCYDLTLVDQANGNETDLVKKNFPVLFINGAGHIRWPERFFPASLIRKPQDHLPYIVSKYHNRLFTWENNDARGMVLEIRQDFHS